MMNDEIDKEKFDELLNEFNKLKLTFKERQNPTFLEIIKKSDRETVWSNILVFYFDPKREHKLGDLMLKSFFEALGKNVEIKNFNTIQVTSEFPTENRKRIDIVIKTENFVLGIENKVNHWLNNDLEEYGRMIDQLAMGKPTYKVVLSKRHECPKNNFVNVTYEVFIKLIKKKLPGFIDKANQEYLFLLMDFLRNIENEINIKEMIENKDAFEYFKLNYNEIGDLLLKFMKFKQEIELKFRDIRDAIDSEMLKISIRQRFENVTYIEKSDIEVINELLTFRIFIKIGDEKIRFPIYINNGYDIYSYAANDEPNESKIETIEDNELLIDLNKDIKEIVHEISEFIEQKMENIFE